MTLFLDFITPINLRKLPGGYYHTGLFTFNLEDIYIIGRVREEQYLAIYLEGVPGMLKVWPDETSMELFNLVNNH